MKRLVATGLAAALAATMVTTSGTAFAMDKNWHPGPPSYHPQYHPHPGPGPGVAAPFLFGTFLGLALAPTVYPPAPPPPYYYPGYPGPSRHIAICTQWYGPWYNPASDLWTDSLGGVHQCAAPY